MGNIYSMSGTVVLGRHFSPKVYPATLLDVYGLSLYGLLLYYICGAFTRN